MPSVTRPTRSGSLLAAFAIMLVAANLRPAVVTVAPLIDDIKNSMGWDSGTAGLLTTLPLLLFGIAALVAARCAARWGAERTIFASLLVLAAGILTRIVPNAVALLIGSALIGVGIGICNVVLPSLIKRDFAHRSGLMTGLYSMTISGGAALAAAVTVPLNHAVGGRWPLGLALWAVPVVVTLVLTLGVWRTQLRRSTPVDGGEVSSSLWRNRIAWAITVLMGTQSLVFYAFAAWLPDMLTDRGMSPGQAGAVLAAGQSGALMLSLIAPVVAGRCRDQRGVAVAMVLMCAAGFLGIVTTERWPVLWVVLVMAAPGALLGVALLLMVLRSVSTAQTGQVSGMAQSVGYILAATGPVVVGALHDLTHSWSIAMGVLAVALIPQAWAAWVSGADVTMTEPVDAAAGLSGRGIKAGA